MESKNPHYVDYIKTVMEEVRQRFGISMFEERYDNAEMAEARMRQLYEARIPPHLAAEALVTGTQPQPRPLSFTPGSKEWAALISVSELARARVFDIDRLLVANGATEGRVQDVVQELRSHVETIEALISRWWIGGS